MKSITVLVLVLLFAGCGRAPDPKIAFLESEIKRLEGELVKTNNYVLSMERWQDTQSALIANHGELIKLMAPAANVEQLKALVLEQSDLIKKHNDLQARRLDIIAAEVFGTSATR